MALASRLIRIAAPPGVGGAMACEVPFWDEERRELWFRNRLVKCFRQPAPNQEAILQAFQEEGWPHRIDDPLSPNGKVKPKVRLHDTVKFLNHQATRLLRFRGDGTGEAVCWEVCDGEASPELPQRGS
jgi:hypothetical protein